MRIWQEIRAVGRFKSVPIQSGALFIFKQPEEGPGGRNNDSVTPPKPSTLATDLIGASSLPTSLPEGPSSILQAAGSGAAA